ncbi:hypothetical protein Emed_001321 [Eimeria media]
MKGVRERRQASSQQRHAGHSSKRSSGRSRHEEAEASTAESFEATAEAEAATIKGRPTKRWPSKAVLALLTPALVFALMAWEDLHRVEKALSEPTQVGEVEPTAPSGAAVPKTPEVEPVPSEELLTKEPGEVGEVEPTGPSEAVVPKTSEIEALPTEFQPKIDALIAWAREAPVSEGKILPVFEVQKKTFEEVVVRNGVKYTLSAKYWPALNHRLLRIIPPAAPDFLTLRTTSSPPATNDLDKIAGLLLKGFPKLLERCTPNEERIRRFGNEFLTRDALFGDTKCGQVHLSIGMKRDEEKTKPQEPSLDE